MNCNYIKFLKKYFIYFFENVIYELFISFFLYLYSSQSSPIPCKYIMSYSLTLLDVCLCVLIWILNVSNMCLGLTSWHLITYQVLFNKEVWFPFSETINCLLLFSFPVLNLMRISTSICIFTFGVLL